MKPSSNFSLLLIIVCDSLIILETMYPSFPRTVILLILVKLFTAPTFYSHKCPGLDDNYAVFLLRKGCNILIYIS